MDRKAIFSWRNLFLALDRLTHLAEAAHLSPLRGLALRRAEKWMLERLEMSDGLGAIYPAMLNAVIALRCLGYAEDHPQVIRARAEFERLGIEDPPPRRRPSPRSACSRPCRPSGTRRRRSSPWARRACRAAIPRMVRAADWLLSKEVRHMGDWAVKVRGTEPGGWYFEFNNEFYPDTDDTAQVLLALNQVDNPRAGPQQEAARRAITWEFAMQCRNGGWGSFDKDCTKMIFENIPFADHNAMLDPPTVDITGRMLEMLAAYGYTRADRGWRRPSGSSSPQQEPDGSWFGRWGVNYIYGTFLVLRGLDAVGVEHREPQIQRAAGGSARCRIPTAAGARPAAPTTNPARAAWARAPRRRRPGRSGPLAAGDDRSDSASPGASGGCSPAGARRQLGRIDRRRAVSPSIVHGDGLSQGVLSGLSPLSTILPAIGARHLSAGQRTQILDRHQENDTQYGHSNLPDVDVATYVL
jgi:squalene-hopene/tetraprenyl-beta-curcumene cyclase